MRAKSLARVQPNASATKMMKHKNQINSIFGMHDWEKNVCSGIQMNSVKQWTSGVFCEWNERQKGNVKSIL